jgi:hypothetical protein
MATKIDNLVGTSSSRTPIKHFILDKLLGRICGVLSAKSHRVPAKLPLLVMDMCAGDGEDTGESGTCSPSIIKKHINGHHMKGQSYAVLVERAPLNYSQLMAKFGNNDNITILNQDSKEINLYKFAQHNKQAIFLHIDPNSLGQWPVTNEFIRALPDTATFLITMGCNVGGLKRSLIEFRMPWFDIVESVKASTPAWHDLILVTLEKDASQWAYLLRTSIKWADQDMALLLRQNRVNAFQFKINALSMRQSPHAFNEAFRVLFLTHKERENGIA